MSSETKYYAHPTSVIDEGCEIGDGTKIWHFCHIMADCKIGENCNLGQNVVVSPGVILGKNVKVQNNVSIYTGVGRRSHRAPRPLGLPPRLARASRACFRGSPGWPRSSRSR